jgi:hypothetical protein
MTDAECRVLADGHFAEIVLASGVSARFVEPGAPANAPRASLGLLRDDDGVLLVRPAGFGDAAIDVRPPDAAGGTLTVRVENLAPDATVAVGAAGAEIVVPTAVEGLSRTLSVPLGEGPQRIAITRPCPAAFRVAALGDIQTNPLHFERIVRAISEESASESGLPLLGMVLVGDLAENAREDQLVQVREMLAAAPVPSAATPGNHDVYTGDEGVYGRVFGPGSYAFAACAARFVMLDTGDGDLADSVEARLPALFDRGDDDWLFGGMHYPAYPGGSDQGFGDETTAWHVLAEAARQGADALIAGHIHDYRDFGDVRVGSRTVRQLVAGTGGATQGVGAPLYGWLELRFDGAFTYCFREVSPPGAEGSSRADVPFCDR